MTLPVPPDARVILQNSVVTLREVVAPLAEDEWARFNASLLIGALEYALGAMEKDRGAEHRSHLIARIDSLRAAIQKSGEAEPIAALAEKSPFEAASRLLVWGQNNPGALATEIQRVLRAELYVQLDQEIAAAEPIKGAFFRGMAGEI